MQREAARRKANEVKSSKARSAALERFQEGACTVGELTDRDLLLIGVGLYWGDGAKRNVGAICMVNMDPTVHALFLRWLGLLGVPIDSVTARLTISDEADVDREQQWWADRLKIPNIRFTKATTRLSPTSRRKIKRPEYHGILTLRCNNTSVWHRIMGMVSRAGFEPSVTAVRGQRPEPLNERDMKIC